MATAAQRRIDPSMPGLPHGERIEFNVSTENLLSEPPGNIWLYSIDPVQMGVIFIANLELGYLHPPVGIHLFLSAYRFKKPMGTIIWATLPFLLILAATVPLITYVPWLTTAPLHWLGK
jgi:Tripartite ATP-independent periplasmic transporter, DctM component